MNINRIMLMTACLSVAAMTMSGCMPRVNVKAEQLQKQAVEQALNTPQVDTSQSGSLWANGGAGLLSDAKASQVGDLVTVLVSENAKASRSLSAKQNKTSDRKTGLSAVLGYETSLSDINTNFKPKTAIDISNSKNFEGSGSTNNSDTLTASVTSVVMHVYPNGNMRVAGKRQLIINHEPQEITFVGVIRAIDIAPNNTIPSSKVAQARISYGSTGALATVTHEGWLAKTLEQLWPL